MCEDDCLLSDNFLINSLDLFDYSKFDLLYLQAVTAHHQNKAEIIKNYPNADWDSNLKIINSNKMIMFEGFAGYCISKSGAQKAIEYIEKNGYDGPIDNLVCHIPNFISVCPVNLQNYLFLDETSKYSYTHTGNFLYNHKLNQINLQSKKQLKLKNENTALLS
ncbi:MAG: glycosyltransferase family 25 protein [Magnetococcus sp. WYHC-3]